jgi:hypothetical protein
MLSVDCPALRHFATLCYKLHDFGKKVMESYFLYKDYVKYFFILINIQQDIMINVHRPSCTLSFIIFRFQ